MPGSLTMGWPKTDHDVTHGMQLHTAQAIRGMNANATEFSAAIDSFDRLARDRLRIASGVHVQVTNVVEPDGRRATA